MKNFFRKVFNELKNPSKKMVIAAFLIFAYALIGTIICLVLKIQLLLAHFLYFISAVSFFYCAYIVGINAKSISLKVKNKIESNRHAKRFATDYNFRTIVCSAGSFLLNAAYTLYNFIYGIIFGELWFIALGGYYLILSAYRGIMVFWTRKINSDKGLSENDKNIKRVKIYRSAGIILFILPIALNTIIWMVRNDIGGFRYYGLTIFVHAVYTVCKVAMAVYNMVKVRKSSDYVVHAVRNLNMVSALVSLFALQTALLSVYGAEGGVNATYNAAFGTVICVFCVIMGIIMIVEAHKQIKKLSFQSQLQTANPLPQEDEEDCPEKL